MINEELFVLSSEEKQAMVEYWAKAYDDKRVSNRTFTAWRGWIDEQVP